MRFNEFNQSIIEGPKDPHIFKAVFMAGSPGAGKSTVANMLFGGTGLKSLNVDTFWQFYKKKGLEKDYDYFWQKYQIQNSLYKSGKLGLLIDGTAKNPEAMRNVKKTLEDEGYETAMVAVNVSLEAAMRRAKARAQQPGPDFGREIDPEFIKDTWNKVQVGMGKLQNIFQERFFVIDNSRDNAKPDVTYAQKALTKWLNSPPSNPIAKKWLQQQQQSLQQQPDHDTEVKPSESP